MVEREWFEKVDLEMTRRVDWPLLRRTVLFARSRVPTPHYSRFYADLQDSNVSSQSFEDLRDAVEPEGEVATQVEMSVIDDRLRIAWTLKVGFGGPEFSEMTFRGPDRDLVLGAAAALRRELDKWRRSPPSEDHEPEGAPVGLRRHLTDPNPWVLFIGGTLIAGVLLGLLTNWFGLGG